MIRSTGFALGLLVLLMCFAPVARAEVHEIANGALIVRFDDGAQSFSAVERATGTAFLLDGKVEGAGRVEGSRIVVAHPDGDTTLELRGDLPFVFVTRERVNRGDAASDTRSVAVLEYRLDLGKAAPELRVMGTAGLTAPDQHPGSYLFLACADPATRRGVVSGWVTQDRGSGVIFSEIRDGAVAMKAQLDYGHLLIPAGERAKLETLAIGVFDDARLGLEQYADLIRAQYDIRLRPMPTVYCSWYSEKHGLAGDAESTVELAKFVAKELKPFGLTVIQIDDEWQDGDKYNGPRRGFERARPRGPYPNGMAPVVEAVQKEGLTFGLWWMPFARNHQAPDYADRQDWFVKREDGTPYETDWGGTSLDLTHPDVQEQIARITRRYRGWGVEYFKMDGLWTGTASEQIYINDGYKDDHFGNNQPFRDPMVTNIEAYRNGLKLIRKNAGENVFLSGCCMAQNLREICAIGLLDAMRIGPDYNADGTGIKTGPTRGSRLYFLNGRVWWNDPDPPIVRASGNAMGIQPVSLEEARLGASWVSMAGQVFLLSDWLPDLAPDRIELLKRTMAHHGATARPVDYFDNALATTWLVTSEEGGPRRDVIGVFNWDEGEMKVEYTLERLGLDPAQQYYAFDFWGNAPLPVLSGTFACALPGRSCRIIAVRAVPGHPVLVSTSRHVTQGIIDVTGETWDGSRLTGVSKVIGGDAYELRIAGMKSWKAALVAVSQVDRDAGVTIEAVSSEPGWLRVKIESPTMREVAWGVQCEAEAGR